MTFKVWTPEEFAQLEAFIAHDGLQFIAHDGLHRINKVDAMELVALYKEHVQSHNSNTEDKSAQ